MNASSHKCHMPIKSEARWRPLQEGQRGHVPAQNVKANLTWQRNATRSQSLSLCKTATAAQMASQLKSGECGKGLLDHSFNVPIIEDTQGGAAGKWPDQSHTAHRWLGWASRPCAIISVAAQASEDQLSPKAGVAHFAKGQTLST